jgi:uncharacterized protein YkwD
MLMARLVWILALTALEAAAPVRRLVPRKAGATTYESQPAAASKFQPFGDALRASLQKAAADKGRKQGTTLVADTRLDAAMTDLARALREGESPRTAAVEFVLSHYGVVEPYPAFVFIRARREAEAAARDELLADLRLPEATPTATIGVGIDRDTSWSMLLVAIQAKWLDLDAVPRQLPHGGQARVTGKLLGKFREPHFYITDPRGAARTLPIESKDARFSAEVACGGDGRYQVEVFGTDAAGPRVLANFPIYCGVAPPVVFEGAAGSVNAPPPKPAAAEALLLELVNRDRHAAGLPPLQADAALAAIARAHSEDMLENAFVGHVSPTTGGPADRVKRAGIAFVRLLENVGRNASVEELETGLMASPGHRAAILDRLATRVGIGIVIATPTPDAVIVYGTQLFR